MNRPILLIGAGGHARACIDVVEQEARFSIAGVSGMPEEVGTRILGYPVVGTDAELPTLVSLHQHVLIAVGQIKSPKIRMHLFETISQMNGVFPTIVSPRAYVSPHAVLGAGTIVMHGAVINAGAVVGRNCIINNMALIEHDAHIADHCHVSTGAIINGGASIGCGTFVGSGTVVREGVTIGDGCVLGMGQRIVRDCPNDCYLIGDRT